MTFRIVRRSRVNAFATVFPLAFATAASMFLFSNSWRFPQESSHGFQQSFYDRYHSAEELLQRMHVITRNCRNSRIETLARSHEHRPIVLVRIGTTDDHNPSRFMITAGMHGRERSTAQIGLYALERFCSEMTKPSNPFSRLEGLFIPLINPDGFERSRTILTKWRKNRRPPPDSKKCDGGVDLNRNWPAFWGLGNGTSSNPCHDQYQGPVPLSEPESQGVAEVLDETKGIRAHVDLHSFGQFLYRSWSYPAAANTTNEQNVERRQRVLARAMRIAIRKAYGNDMVDLSVRLATITMTKRLNGGTSLDYVMELGIPSITAEIGPRLTNDNAATGYETPERDLLMRSREMFEGLKMVVLEADPEGNVPEYTDEEIGIVLP